jgi:hypothetical protein
MPQFDDVTAFLSPTLDLPWAGKTYRVPSPPALVGLRLQAAWAVTNAKAAGVDAKAHHLRLLNDDDGSTSLEQDALGPVYDEMVADRVPLEVLNHAGMTAYLWIVAGDDAAKAWWESPAGKAPRPVLHPKG